MNGKDVSNLAHEDAVNEFLRAEEPIMVEVKRRQSNAPTEQIPLDSNVISGGSKVTATNESPTASKLSSRKSILFGAPQLYEQQKSIETTSVEIQTELMLCDFENEYICQSNDSSIQVEHHLNGEQINHSDQHNSNNNNNNNNNGHHSLHHCTMLNDCIVPPEIDIEVSF